MWVNWTEFHRVDNMKPISFANLWQAKHDKSGMSFKSSIEFQ